MSKWEVMKIRDLGRVVTGKTPPTNEPAFYNGPFKFVSPKDMDRDSTYIQKTETTLAESAIKKFKNQVIPRNSVMYTILSFGFGKIGIATEEVLTNQQVTSIIVSDRHCFKFVYYLLRANTDYFFTFNSGIDTPLVPKSVFEGAEVRVPDVATQRSISSFLWSFDELIVANFRKVSLLESMASLLYREWFVSFKFPGHQNIEKFDSGLLEFGMIPDGWSIQPLSKVADFLNGYAFSQDHWKSHGKPIIKIAELKNGLTSKTPFYHGNDIDKKYHVSKGDLLFSWSGDFGSYIWDEADGLLNQHLFLVKPKSYFSKSFIHQSLLLNLKEFNSKSTGTTMKHIKRAELDSIRVVCPSQQVLNEFDKLVNPIIDLILNYKRQIRLLSQCRDMFLKKLIAGEIEPPGLPSGRLDHSNLLQAATVSERIHQ